MPKAMENECQKIRILIADDHKLIRESCSTVLNSNPRFKVVGLASDGKEALQLTKQKLFDILIMDINMKPMDGFEASTLILGHSPETKIIAVSMNSGAGHIKKILDIGARGYVNKNSSMDEFVKAILAVNSGEKYFCSETRDMLARKFLQKEATAIDLLTARELSIIRLLKDGLSSMQVGQELGIAGKTVEVHRYNILKKFKARNTAMVLKTINEHGI